MDIKRILAIGRIDRQAGREEIETFHAPSFGGELIQYTYHARDGRTFTTFAASLVAARGYRDAWLTPRQPVFKIDTIRS